MGWRILHTEWSKGWGGQEIRIIDESLAFIKKGYNMMIACQPGSMMKAEAKKAGIPTLLLKMRSGVDASAIIKSFNLLRAQEVDLVHTHSSVDSWCCSVAARIRGIPVVRSRHLSTPISKSPFSYFLYMKLADRIITSGSTVRQTMITENGFSPQKIVSVPAGVDEKRFSPSAKQHEARKEFGLRADDFVVGVVAVLRRWKGHHFLIEAVERLSQNMPRIRLLIVGDGPQERNLRNLIRGKNLEQNVIMTGFRRDVPRVLEALDCFVLPSTKNEAASQVLPQAMAMGLPVVAADAGGASEVVNHRHTGLLVPRRDPDALARAIRWIYENKTDAQKMAERGTANVLRNCTFTKTIQDTEQVYLRLLEGSI